MHIALSTNVMGHAEVLRQLQGLTGQQAASAYAKAINDAAFEVRRAMQAEMRAVFDKPTNYILRSPRVVMAKPGKLTATIEPAYMGGKGVDPQKILNAQSFGGTRRDKRSEVALRRVGILPNGYQTAIPRSPFPGSDDGKGNLKGSFLVQLISYFQAFGEQGYRANMTAKRKQRLARGKTGRRYIVTYGNLRAGARTTARGEPDQRASNLAPGIWAVTGTGGVSVAPVLMFVRAGRYQPLFQMEQVAKRADVDNYLERRIRYRLRQAAGV